MLPKASGAGRVDSDPDDEQVASPDARAIIEAPTRQVASSSGCSRMARVVGVRPDIVAHASLIEVVAESGHLVIHRDQGKR